MIIYFLPCVSVYNCNLAMTSAERTSKVWMSYLSLCLAVWHEAQLRLTPPYIPTSQEEFSASVVFHMLSDCSLDLPPLSPYTPLISVTFALSSQKFHNLA